LRITAIETWADFLLPSHSTDTKGDAVPVHDIEAKVTVNIQLYHYCPCEESKAPTALPTGKEPTVPIDWQAGWASKPV